MKFNPWTFLLKERAKEKEKQEYRVCSFLFATEINNLNILSIERINDYTELHFINKDGEYKQNYHRFYITEDQHEDFIEKISKDIKCIVIPGTKE